MQGMPSLATLLALVESGFVTWACLGAPFEIRRLRRKPQRGNPHYENPDDENPDDEKPCEYIALQSVDIYIYTYIYIRMYHYDHISL